MKIRNQSRILGVKREALPSCVLKEIREKVTELAKMYNCSKSFVIATTLAEAFNIKKQEKYYENSKRISLLRRAR